MQLYLLASLFLAKAAHGYQDVRSNLEGRKIIEVPDHYMEDFHSQFEEHLDVLHKSEGKTSILVPNHVLTEFDGDIADVTDSWVDQLQSNFDSPDLFCTESSTICAARNTQDFFSSYQSLAALTERIGNLVAGSNLATRKVIGRTTEGRDIHVIEIGDQSKPLAYFMCNIHAREWLSSMYCPYMIEKLLENGGHRILDTFSFAIIPTGNPDGFEYSRLENSFWRKTRNVNPGSRCIGTDPNRNYANNHCGPGTSNNPCSDIYCGPRPFSTPEVNAINQYAQANKDRIITWIDFHAYASMWLSPLGYARGVPPAVDYNRMFKCMTAAKDAIRSETGLNYRVGGAADLLGAAAGASDDYFYFELDVIYSFTVEMRGNSFQPSASNISPNNRELFAGMIAQMDCIEDTELRASEEIDVEGDGSQGKNKGIKSAGLGMLLIGVGILLGVVASVINKKRKPSTNQEEGTRQVTV